MIIKFDVVDNKNQAIGKTTLTLNWGSHQWQLTEDKAGSWQRVTTVKSGLFEYKDWGVMWLWDDAKGKGNNIDIIHDAPSRAMDFDTLGSTARLFAPADPSMKDVHLKWTLDLSGKESNYFAIVGSPLPFSRGAYVQRINWMLPAPYASVNYNLVTDNLDRNDKRVTSTPGKYTTCGSLPGFVSKQVAFSKRLKGKAFENWMKKYSLNGTNQVRDIGNKYGCWVESASNIKPKPGDVYVLLDHGATDKKKSGISHVGVFDSEVGNKWKTLDFGQHGGFDGDFNFREYKPGTTELYGESNQGGGYRVLAGWVDLERYFGLG